MNAIQNAAAPNPWVVKESKTFTPLPSGAYIAKFTGVEDVKLPSGDDRWRWTWEVTTGEHKGQRADALTEQSISPNALAGRLLAGLLRRPLAAGENVQAAIAAAVGQADLVTIAAGPKGGSKGGVKTVNALPM